MNVILLYNWNCETYHFTPNVSVDIHQFTYTAGCSIWSFVVTTAAHFFSYVVYRAVIFVPQIWKPSSDNVLHIQTVNLFWKHQLLKYLCCKSSIRWTNI